MRNNSRHHAPIGRLSASTLRLWLRDSPGPAAPTGAADRQAGPVVVPTRRAQSRLICAQCGHVITRPEARIERGGDFLHRRSNPHGYEFEFGCFAEAEGAAALGEVSEAFTWFSGYAWQLAVCRRCDLHLGWCFRAAADVFFGLILDRLRRVGP